MYLSLPNISLALISIPLAAVLPYNLNMELRVSLLAGPLFNIGITNYLLDTSGRVVGILHVTKLKCLS